MKFYHLLKKRSVPEWSAFYINYKLLKTLLKPFKTTSDIYVRTPYLESFRKSCSGECKPGSIENLEITNLPKDTFPILNGFNEQFKKRIFVEKEKIDEFFTVKFEEVFKKFREFKINSRILKKYKEKDLDAKTAQLKNASLSFYQELSFLIEYFPLNFEGFRKIIKKHVKITNKLSKNTFELNFKISDLFNDTFVQNNYLSLQKLKQDFENLYLETFFCHDHKEGGRAELSRISQGRAISPWESYFFGFFSGCAIIFLIMVLLLAFQGSLDPDTPIEDEYYRQLFPVYRGASFVVLYIWLLAWNVYVWSNYHINYKLIFKFSHHYSKFNEIMRRGACFATLFFISFICFIIHKEKNTKLYELISWFGENNYPFIFWLPFFLYMLLPFKKFFNGEGRLYMYKIMRNIFFFSCFFVNFIINWSTDQLVSFVIFIRDFEYTFCFYINLLLRSDVKNCSDRKLYWLPFVAATIPLLLRMIQCLRSNFQNNRRRIVILHPDTFNFLKYLSSFAAALFSLLYSLESSNLNLTLWIVGAILSSLYSYYWDLKMDWGFLQPKSKYRFLRTQLSYPKIYWYYLAIIFNLILRFSWTLSLSIGIIEDFGRKEMIIFIVGFLEIFRRAIWNFFRVEKEHVNNCGIFRAVEEYKLPFETSPSKYDEKVFEYKEKNQGYLAQTSISSFKPPNMEGDQEDLTTSLIQNQEISLNFNLHSAENAIEYSKKTSSKGEKISINKNYKNTFEKYNFYDNEEELKELKLHIKKFVTDLKESSSQNFRLTMKKESEDSDKKGEAYDISFQEELDEKNNA